MWREDSTYWQVFAKLSLISNSNLLVGADVVLFPINSVTNPSIHEKIELYLKKRKQKLINLLS